jgi:DNA repair protein SbcC/Rad50
MQITRIDLHNIKSYEDERIEFALGTNAICGENGAGKSTLLEAIGLALFGYAPLRQADFLREGCSAGTITVGFVASDEREYEIVRRLGASSSYYVHDAELGLRLAEGKADVQAWLCQRLGVSASTDLGALFGDAIGVPQGLLTAVFLDGRTERKSKFDPLLRVDEYRRAWEQLRLVERFLDDRMGDRRVKIAELQTLTAELPAIEEQLASLSQAIDGTERRLAAFVQRAEMLADSVEGFRAQQSRLDQLARRLELSRERAEAKRRRLEEVRLSLEKAQVAAFDCEQSAEGHERYREAQGAMDRLEERRRRREGLRERRAEAERE